MARDWTPDNIEILSVEGKGFILRDKTTGATKQVKGITRQITKAFDRDHYDTTDPMVIARRERGIEVHNQISEYIKTQGVSRPTAQRAWDALTELSIKFPESEGWELQSEIPVTDFNKYATNIDLVAYNKYTNKAILVDFKTGQLHRDVASAQLTMEKKMYQLAHPGVEVTDLYIHRPGHSLRPFSRIDEMDNERLRQAMYGPIGSLTKRVINEDKLALKNARTGTSLLWKKALPLQSNEGSYGRTMTFFDIETGPGDQVLSVAAMKVKPNKATGKFELLDVFERYYLPMKHGASAGKQMELESIHGLTPDIIRKLRKQQKNAGLVYDRIFNPQEQKALRDFIGDSIVAGHNIAQFDIPFSLARHWPDAGAFGLPGNSRETGHRIFDTLMVAENARGRGKGVNDLATLFRLSYGQTMEQAGLSHHRALADVEANIKITEAMMQSQGVMGEVSRLMAYSSLPWSTIFAEDINDSERLVFMDDSGEKYTLQDAIGKLYGTVPQGRITDLSEESTQKENADRVLDPTVAQAAAIMPSMSGDQLDAFMSAMAKNTRALADSSAASREASSITFAATQLNQLNWMARYRGLTPAAFGDILQGTQFSDAAKEQLAHQHAILNNAYNLERARKLLPRAIKAGNAALTDTIQAGLTAKSVSNDQVTQWAQDIDNAQKQTLFDARKDFAYTKVLSRGYGGREWGMHIQDAETPQQLYAARLGYNQYVRKEQLAARAESFGLYDLAGRIRDADTDQEIDNYQLQVTKERNEGRFRQRKQHAAYRAEDMGFTELRDRMLATKTDDELFALQVEQQNARRTQQFETRRRRHAERAEMRGDDKTAEAYRLVRSEEDLWRVRQQEIIANEQLLHSRRQLNSVQPYDFFRLADITYQETGRVMDSAKGVIPEALRRPGARIIEGYAQTLMAKKEQVQGIWNAVTQGVLPVAGAFVGNAVMPGVGAALGYGLGAGATQIVGNLMEGGVKSQSYEIQAKFNQWAGLLDLASTSMGVFQSVLDALAKALKALVAGATAAALALNALMRSGLNQMNKMATPMTTMTGVSYADYQQTSMIDAFAHLGAGATYASMEQLSAMGNALYTTGTYDSNKLTAAAMLGVFSDVYQPGGMSGERYYDIVNKLALRVASSSNQAQTLAQIKTLDPTMAQTIQVMQDFGVTDVRQLASRQGMYWNPVTNEEAKRFRVAGYEYALANEQWDVSKMRLSAKLWEMVGKQAYDTANEVFDLMSQGKFNEAWEVLKERVGDLWSTIKANLEDSGFDTSSATSFFQTLWDKFSDSLISTLSEVMPKLKPIFMFIYDSVSDIALAIAENLWRVFGDFVTKMSDIKINPLHFLNEDVPLIEKWSDVKISKGKLAAGSSQRNAIVSLVDGNIVASTTGAALSPDKLKQFQEQQAALGAAVFYDTSEGRRVILPNNDEARRAVQYIAGLNNDPKKWSHVDAVYALGNKYVQDWASDKELETLHQIYRDTDVVGNGIETIRQQAEGDIRNTLSEAYDVAAAGLPSALKATAEVVVKVVDNGKELVTATADSNGRVSARSNDPRVQDISTLHLTDAMRGAASVGGFVQ